MDDDGILRADAPVAQYRMARVIGRGGFGITYEALDTHLKRPVAIKEYFPHGIASRAADGSTLNCQPRCDEAYQRGLERFLEEARALAQFHDPRIVRVHGFLEANNTAYMVMDMEQGCLLREQVLQHGRLQTDEARRVLIDILQALQVVHGRNYLHRDIKPSNLMRRPDGQIVLLDFGSARMSQLEEGKGHTVVVTPGYAPIEQYDAGTSQGPGIDLYATGASLLFCLTGQAPPDGFRRAVAMQSNEPDPVEPLLNSVSGQGASELVDIVRWLMRPQAAHRPPTARSVLDSLQAEAWPGEPTLINPPAQLAEMRSIPSRLVEPMRLHLEKQVGSGATTLLFGSIRAAKSAQDLIDRVAAQIPEGETRSRASEGLRRILTGGQADANSTAPTALPSRTTGAGSSATRQTVAVAAPIADEATSQLLGSELAKHIGPIAHMLVKRSLARTTSRAELLGLLAAEIAEPADRAAFLKAIERLPAFSS